MGCHTVEKIGGTSMSRFGELMDNIIIGRRTGKDLYNRIFVVSAYGGITNLLLENKKNGEPGVYAHFAAGCQGIHGGGICVFQRGLSAQLFNGLIGHAVAQNHDILHPNPSFRSASSVIRRQLCVLFTYTTTFIQEKQYEKPPENKPINGGFMDNLSADREIAA